MLGQPEDPVDYDALLPELRDFYQRNAAQRDETPKTGWKVEERQRFLGYLQREGKQRLLEIGAGTGHDSVFFRDQGLDVTCTDLSPAMVARCRAKGLTAHVMDFLHLDFPAESFDAVYALNCLLHVPKADLPAVLARIAALLRVGGLFFYGVYGGHDWEGPLDEERQPGRRFFSYFADDRLPAVVAPFFTVEYYGVIPMHFAERATFQSLILRKRDGLSEPEPYRPDA
jgi:SAM-dependent methyltransferase